MCLRCEQKGHLNDGCGFSGSSCTLAEAQASRGGEEHSVSLPLGFSVMVVGRERGREQEIF